MMKDISTPLQTEYTKIMMINVMLKSEKFLSTLYLGVRIIPKCALIL